MPVVPKSFSYAQKKYPSEARNKSGKQLISCNSKRQIIERTEKQNASSRYFNSSRAHHAVEGKFDEPIGSAGNRPQGGLCKPPARPVVMIRNNSKQGLTKASFRAAILLTSVSKMVFVVRSVSRHAKLRGGLLMNPKTVKKALKDAIQAMTDYKWLFSARPGKDNTRNRKFPIQKVIPLFL